MACRGDPPQTARDAAPYRANDADTAALDSLLAEADRVYRRRTDSAFLLYERAAEMSRAAGDTARLATALTSMGLAAWRSGDYAGGRGFGEEALALKRQAGLDSLLFRSWNALGLLDWDQGRLFDALDRFDRAFELARARNDSASLARAFNNSALVHRLLGDFASARAGFAEALAIARATGDDFIEGRVLSDLATLEVGVGNAVAAVPLIEDAIELGRRAEDPAGVAYAVGQLGVAHAALGNPGRAAALLDSALALSRELGFRQEEASNLEHLAVLELEAGRPRRALALFAEASEINRELGLAMELGADLRSEAEIYLDLGDAERARDRGVRALAIHREVGVPEEVLFDLMLLAEIDHEAGDDAAADLRLAAAGEVSEALGTTTGRAHLAVSRGGLAERGGRPREALRLIAAAAGDLEAAAVGIRWRAWSIQSRAWAALGELDSARVAGLRAIDAIERTRATYGAGALRSSYQAHRRAVYSDLVETLLRLDRVDEALAISDAARGQTLRQELASVGGGSAAPGAAGALARAEDLLSRIDSLSLRIEEIDAAANGSSGAAARLYQALERVRTEYEQTLDRASADSRGMSVLGGRRITSAEVRAALHPGEVLVEFLSAPDRLFVFVATSDDLEAFTSEVASDDLTTRVRLARDLLARRQANPPGLSSVLAALHDILLGPALAAGALDGANRLIVVPHAELDYLPFSALRDGPDGPHLAERFALLQVPSAASLIGLRGEAAAGATRAPGEAFAPFPDELPAADREIEALSRFDAEARLLRGAGATEPRFREALGRGALVHAATHGVLNAWNPMFSRIELARSAGDAPGSTADGRLEVHEVLALMVRSPLVFLSGCETGLGATGSTRFARGEDYATLAQAFLYAGAENVLATLWRIDDEGAAVFAERFFDALAGQPSRNAPDFASALAVAQREMLEDPRFDAPYYWAGYVLNGSGGSLPPRPGEAASGGEPTPRR